MEHGNQTGTATIPVSEYLELKTLQSAVVNRKIFKVSVSNNYDYQSNLYRMMDPDEVIEEMNKQVQELTNELDKLRLESSSLKVNHYLIKKWYQFWK